MHVDVDQISGDDDVETERWTRARRNRRAIRLLGCAHDAVIANGAAIHGEEEAAAGRAHVRGTLDQSGHVNGAVDIIDRHETLRERRAPQSGETTLQ